MPNRLMVYGGCNVHYTMFKFGENADGRVELKDVNWKSSSNGCGDEDDKIMNRIATVRYLQPVYYETYRNVLFLDEEGNTLFEGSTIVTKWLIISIHITIKMEFFT